MTHGKYPGPSVAKIAKVLAFLGIFVFITMLYYLTTSKVLTGGWVVLTQPMAKL